MTKFLSDFIPKEGPNEPSAPNAAPGASTTPGAAPSPAPPSPPPAPAAAEPAPPTPDNPPAPDPAQQQGATTSKEASPDDPTKTEPPAYTNENGILRKQGASAAPKGDPSPAKSTPADFSTELSKLTGGQIKSQEDFQAMFNDYQTLKTSPKAPAIPEFKSEEAKNLYGLLSSSDTPVADLEKYLSLQKIKTDTLDEKGLLFAHFRLKNQYLTEAQASRLFEGEYEDKYGLEDELTQTRREVAVAEARREISAETQGYEQRIQSFFDQSGKPAPEEGTPANNAEPDGQQAQSQEEIQEHLQKVDSFFNDFGGFSLKTGKEEGEVVEYPFSENRTEDVSLLRNLVENPLQAVQQLLIDRYVDETGNLNYQEMSRAMAMLAFGDDMLNEVYRTAINHATEQGRQEKTNTLGKGAQAMRSVSTSPSNARVPFTDALAQALQNA